MNQFKWTEYYSQLIERNIGIISEEEQEQLRTTIIALFGVGGMGGRVAEILVRSGCENLRIIDHDRYSISNLSTQFITKNDIGKIKVDVLSEKLHEINPNAVIRKYYSVTENNISPILEDTDLATLTLDGPLASILVARECRKRNIPLVEAWSLPYAYAWWFTQGSMDYESCYKLETRDLNYSQLNAMPTLAQHFRDRIFSMLERFPGFGKYYNYANNSIEKMRNGSISLRSFAPFVFMTSSFIANELIFAGILKRKHMNLAPEIHAFDYFTANVWRFQV